MSNIIPNANNNPSAVINAINKAINNPSIVNNAVNKAANVAEVVNKAANVANAAEVVNKVANAAEVVNKAANAANAAEVVNKVANAAEVVNKAANAAEVVNKAANAAEVVNKVANAAEVVNKVANAAEVVNKAANAAEVVNKAANAADAIGDLPRFAYTGSGYWGGSWYPYWTLMIITVIGGFVGADHFWIRSPATGILKFWINIFTLGAWYFYDIIQIFKDKETVLKTGLSIPILGAQGIGAGIFTDGKNTKSKDEPGVTSPWRWLVFLMLVWYPFGLDSFVAGDGMGAIVKFIGTFLPLLWPIMIIWKCIDLYQTFISPASIWSNGLIRFFPFSFIMNPTYPTKLGPSQPLKPVGQDGLLHALGPLGEALGIVARPVIEGVIAPVTTAVGAAATTVEVAANSTSEILKAVTGTAVPVIKTTSAIVKLVPQAINAIPSIASAATGNLAAFSDPKKLAEMAVKQGAMNISPSNSLLSNPTKLATMTGGFSGSSDTISIGAVILVISILLGGGLLLGGLRLKEVLKQNNNVRSKDDKPLETPTVRSFT